MGDIVVIGAGQAGSSLVAKLRGLGHDGQITLIGEEPVPPYQRPPLSKAYLLGKMELDRLYLRPASYYAEHDITLITDARVTHIDRDAQNVHLGDRVLSYDQLALTTGSYPKHLPAAIGGELGGVHVVRTLADVDAMAPSVSAGKTALIVGGGYIGLEAAAVAALREMNVILIEAAERILKRVAAPETADYYRELHRSHGVDIREGIGLTALTGSEGQVEQAVLSDGTELDVDLVIVGIGIDPASALAEAAGLTLDNGIKTDLQGRTSDPRIWAAGDCASLPFRGAQIRLESVQNAIDQAECVAENMLGADKAYRPKPWFWSDQYDVKLQIAGLSTGYDRTAIRDSGSSMSVWYYQGDTLLAVDAMNAPRDYMIGKRLIEAEKSPPPEVVADPASNLKALLKG